MNYQTSIEIEVVVSRHFDSRKYVIVPNVSWGMFGYELDLCLLNHTTMYAYEVEIKVSKSDLKRDAEKRHHHNWNGNMIRGLYFAMPQKMETCIDLVPEAAGVLLVSDRGHVTVARPAQVQHSRKWTFEEAYKLARLGTMRVWPLKEGVVRRMKQANPKDADTIARVKADAKLKEMQDQRLARYNEIYARMESVEADARDLAEALSNARERHAPGCDYVNDRCTCGLRDVEARHYQRIGKDLERVVKG